MSPPCAPTGNGGKEIRKTSNEIKRRLKKLDIFFLLITTMLPPSSWSWSFQTCACFSSDAPGGTGRHPHHINSIQGTPIARNTAKKNLQRFPEASLTSTSKAF